MVIASEHIPVDPIIYFISVSIQLNTFAMMMKYYRSFEKPDDPVKNKILK